MHLKNHSLAANVIAAHVNNMSANDNKYLAFNYDYELASAL
jgi:hypothetical protein